MDTLNSQDTMLLVSVLADLEIAFDKLRSTSRLDEDVAAEDTQRKRLIYVALAVNHLRDELHGIIRSIRDAQR